MDRGQATEREIWACAGRIVEQHGDKARMIATIRADELRERGDFAGGDTWSRIALAIEAIQKPVPGPGECSH